MGGGKRGYSNIYIINNNYILFIHSYIAGRGAHIAEVLNVTMSHVTVSTLGPMEMKENGALAGENGALADGNGPFGKEFET